MTCTAIILAAGMASRMKGTNKQLLSLGGKAVILRSALNFQNTPEVTEIIIAAKEDDKEEIERMCLENGITKLKIVCTGGETRSKSAEKAFAYAGKTLVTAIHDGARPFALPPLISQVVKAAEEYGGAVAAVAVKDTIKVMKDGFVDNTPDRSTLWSAQTPQAFRTELYREMLAMGEATDDSQLAERMGIRVKIVEGSYDNIKMTTPEDIALGENIVKRTEK